MKLDAVLHIPMSEYCCGLDERHIVYRLRCARGDLQRVTLFYADTACRVNPILFTSVPMEKVLSDACHDYWQVIVDSPYNRVYYYFQLDDGTETKLYYSNLFTDRLAQDRSEYFKLPFNHRSDIARVPAWVKDAVVYNIFPDSFASGKCEISGQPHSQRFGQQTVRGKLGGTLDGVAQNVDYLKALGVNCVYLNPIFAAGEYHKYDLLDYYHVDPCFGGNEAFRTMVNTLHASGIRVIIDGVFNHCGWHFFAFEDVVKNQEKSRYRGWFYDLTFPVHRPETPEEIPDYACFAYERMMPKLNTANPEVQKYFCDVGAYWVREYGIDGWRLDVADELPVDFLRKLRAAAKAADPEAVVLGEVWEDASNKVAYGETRCYCTGDTLDSVMNYPVREAILNFVMGKTSASTFVRLIHHQEEVYPAQFRYALMNLVGSHDRCRALNILAGRECQELSKADQQHVHLNVEEYELAVRRYKLCIDLLCALPGCATVYYGDEVGLTGCHDPWNRRAFPWGREDKSLQKYVANKLRHRQESDLLRLGYCDIEAPDDDTLLITRRMKDGHDALGQESTVTGKEIIKVCRKLH